MKSISLTSCVFAAVAFLLMSQAKPDELGKAPSPSANPMRGKKAGEVRGDNGLKLKLVWCPPGKFEIGSPDTDKERQSNEDHVEVSLTNGFWLGQTEVTQGQWERVMESTPWKEKRYVKEGADFPATNVSWENAMEFCRKLTGQERSAGRLPKGWEYTLPTDAEWEYACRAGTTTRYSFGDDAAPLSDYAWWGAFSTGGNTTTEEYAHQVGLKRPNLWGLHDMHGNVFEWCLDWREARRLGGADEFDALSGPQPVYRGGSWNYDAGQCRSAYRRRSSPTYHSYIVGFRVAASVSADRPDGKGRTGLTNKELSGTWRGAQDGVKVKITFRGTDDATWQVNTEAASIGAELKRVEDKTLGSVYLQFDYFETATGKKGSAVLGQLERDESGTLRVTILPAASKISAEYKPVERVPLAEFTDK